MVFDFLNKQKREQASKEREIYQKALAEERLRQAPKVARERARIEARGELSRERLRAKSKAKGGGGIVGGLSKLGESMMGEGGLKSYSTPVMDQMGTGEFGFGSTGSGKKKRKNEDPFAGMY